MAGQTYEYPTPQQLQAYISGVRGGRAPINMPGSMNAITWGTPATAPGSPMVAGAPAMGMTKPKLMALGNGAFRVLQPALPYRIEGADAGQVFFAPMQPLQPVAQPPQMAVQGRPWDYPLGFNTWVTPRTGFKIDFGTLKSLATGYDILRVLIERVKDKIIAQQWKIMPKDKRKKKDTRCLTAEAFFRYPDKMHTWRDWLRELLEQYIVYDAPAIWLRPTRGGPDAINPAGNVFSMEIMDGSMFSPKIMADGRLPPPDVGPAYQQVIKTGLPAVDYVLPVPKGQSAPDDPSNPGWPMPELLYKPRNPRVDSPYGFGPVEQIITTVNIGLYRESYFLSYYSNGSIPNTVFTVPATWTPNQIADFKVWWDSVLAGNVATRSGGAMFVPDGAKPYDMKDKIVHTDDSDQWLIRIMCFTLGLNPMPFVKQMNRGQEKQHHDESAQEGLEPWNETVTDLLEHFMALKWGWDDLTAQVEEDEAVDPSEQATIDQILVSAKIYHPDEIRAKRGDDPMPDDMREEMDVATFNAAPNSTVLSDKQQAAEDKRSQANMKATQQHETNMATLNKPEPGQPPQPGANEPTAAQKAHEVELAKLSQPVVTVAAPIVNVTPAPVNVTVPQPEVTVGAVTVRNQIDKSEQRETAGKTTTVVKRDANNQLVAEITETTRRVVKSERVDGKLLAKVEE